jgi:CBS domain-containing protein
MVKTDDIKKYIVYNKSSVREVLKAIDQNKEGIAFVVDDNLTLLGTISDGDIRRFILKGGDISLNCEEIMNPSYIYVEEYNYDEIKRLMAV